MTSTVNEAPVERGENEEAPNKEEIKEPPKVIG
jgi:hypothetical protein